MDLSAIKPEQESIFALIHRVYSPYRIIRTYNTPEEAQIALDTLTNKEDFRIIEIKLPKL